MSQQHFLKPNAKVQDIVDTLPLQGKCILELGAGTGELTRVILGAWERVKSIIAVEYDKTLQHPHEESLRVTYVWQDLYTLDYDEIFKEGPLPIISFPPYDALDFIRKMVDKYKIQDVMLLVPERELPHFQEYKVVHILQGIDFDPESTGNHYIILKGFHHLKTKFL